MTRVQGPLAAGNRMGAAPHVGEAHMRHMFSHQETCWLGYNDRADSPTLDDVHRRVFVNSRFDATSDR
jgi:succinate dehydrogenase/fumarate reductase flavoprotein subunit